MAGEDWRDDNGVSLSKLARQKKVKNGRGRFDKLLEKYDLEIIDDYNNVISFRIMDKVYYYGCKSKKIREKGSNVWTSRIMDKLKSDFDNKIPLRNEDNK